MRKNNCILQVEDEDDDVFLLRHAFGRAGIGTSLRVVTDGEQAIDYLTGLGDYGDRVRYPMPCLVLLDLKLPKVSGIEVLEWIRAQPSLKGVVVVVLSSSSLAADIERAYASGANSYICKPHDLHGVCEIAQLLKGWWLGYNRFAPINEPGRPLEPVPDVDTLQQLTDGSRQ